MKIDSLLSEEDLEFINLLEGEARVGAILQCKISTLYNHFNLMAHRIEEMDCRMRSCQRHINEMHKYIEAIHKEIVALKKGRK